MKTNLTILPGTRTVLHPLLIPKSVGSQSDKLGHFFGFERFIDLSNTRPCHFPRSFPGVQYHRYSSSSCFFAGKYILAYFFLFEEAYSFLSGEAFRTSFAEKSSLGLHREKAFVTVLTFKTHFTTLLILC